MCSLIKDPTLVSVLGAAVVALASLVGVGIRAILTGRLVTKPVLDRAYAESDKWERAYITSQETLREVVQQGNAEVGTRMDANTEGLRTMGSILDAFVARGQPR